MSLVIEQEIVLFKKAYPHAGHWVNNVPFDYEQEWYAWMARAEIEYQRKVERLEADKTDLLLDTMERLLRAQEPPVLPSADELREEVRQEYRRQIIAHILECKNQHKLKTVMYFDSDRLYPELVDELKAAGYRMHIDKSFKTCKTIHWE